MSWRARASPIPPTAELLNHDFVSIKVDREERPEVDQIYMRALHALGEQGGWPLTMFLTPDAEPFWGGTYFPPEPRWGRPSFRQILGGVSAPGQSRTQPSRQNAAALRAASQPAGRAATDAPPPDLLDEAAKSILSIWDMRARQLQRRAEIPQPGRAWRCSGAPACGPATRLSRRRSDTLTFLCQGGIYDHVGGGFARYSIDAAWLVPHFEKMLYDNGLLLSRSSPTPIAETRRASVSDADRRDGRVGWFARCSCPGGGFASSLDADTEHEEGLTYVWSWAELEAALGSDFPASPASTTLRRRQLGGQDHPEPACRAGPATGLAMTRKAVSGRSARICSDRRNERPQPGRDDKVLADWNGLAISGLAHAARGHRQRDGAARPRCRPFISSPNRWRDGDRLAHSALEGGRVFPGVATDYANMIRAALDLFSLDGEPAYVDQAESLVRGRQAAPLRRRRRRLQSRRRRRAGADRPAALHRRRSHPGRDRHDGGNAATLFMLTGNEAYREHAERIARASLGRTRPGPRRLGQPAIGFRHASARAAGVRHGGAGQRPTRFWHAALAEPDPALLIAAGRRRRRSPGHPAAGKRPSGAAALFLCDALRCLPEIATPRSRRSAAGTRCWPDQIRRLLRAHRYARASSYMRLYGMIGQMNAFVRSPQVIRA